MKPDRLFHISETPDIPIFKPRPSPSYFEAIQNDVVFAVSDKLLHNYLLPRECPRVTFYAKRDTTQIDREKFLGNVTVDYVIAIEEKWYKIIQRTTLYCYELPPDSFNLLDEGAGYYISYRTITPVSIHKISDILAELLARNVELRLMPSLMEIAKEVSVSSLHFSLIRMRNAC